MVCSLKALNGIQLCALPPQPSRPWRKVFGLILGRKTPLLSVTTITCLTAIVSTTKVSVADMHRIQSSSASWRCVQIRMTCTPAFATHKVCNITRDGDHDAIQIITTGVWYRTRGTMPCFSVPWRWSLQSFCRANTRLCGLWWLVRHCHAAMYKRANLHTLSTEVL